MAKEPEVNTYILKDGAEHTYIKEGNQITLKGDGVSTTVELTDDQAKVFADKLVASPNLERVKEINSQTVPLETVAGTSADDTGTDEKAEDEKANAPAAKPSAAPNAPPAAKK